MLAAHMEFEPEQIDRLTRFWKSDHVATAPGLKAVELFDAVADGRIKALWIMATNPVDSMPEADRVRDALRQCPFVVVSDMNAATDTAIEAQVRLPAAGWGEKDGTVTNSERRISRQRPFLPLPGAARPDWWIVSQVAHRMGFGAAFAYRDAGEIFAEHAALSAFENEGRRDFDLSGLIGHDYETLEPIQWPVRAAGTARMFTDGRFFTASGRAQFVAIVPPPPIVPPPGMLILNTGRVRDHWHTMTRTGKTPRLSAHMAEPFAEIHPDDATEHGIRRATLVRLENRFGSAIVRALITERQQRGSVFVPLHWTDRFAASARVDALVRSQTDPQSGQPALKMSTVAIEPAATSWYGFLVSRARPDFGAADYWALAEAPGGYRSELGFVDAVADWSGWVRDALAVSDPSKLLTITDRAGGRQSVALFDSDRLIFALFCARDPVLVSRQWAVSLLNESIEPVRRADILAGRPGAGRPDPGPIVCACNSVGAYQINAAVRSGCRTVEEVGIALQAGTNCGSCRAEIRTLIDTCLVAAAELSS